jgi:hypothetical protein
VIGDHLVVVALRSEDVAEVGPAQLDRVADDRLEHLVELEATTRHGADDLA